MSEYFELAKALVQHQKALLELESALNDVRKMLINVADQEPGPIPSDEELENQRSQFGDLLFNSLVGMTTAYATALRKEWRL
jgi:hypothetical protein